MNEHRISMQGCFPYEVSEVKFSHLDSSLRAPLSQEWTPIVMLVKRRNKPVIEKAISRYTLKVWMDSAPKDSKNMPEYLKALEAYNFATDTREVARG